MTNMRKVTLALGMALGVVAAPAAQADVIINYQPVGTLDQRGDPLSLRGPLVQIVLTDEAYRAGYSFTYDFSNGRQRIDNAVGLVEAYGAVVRTISLLHDYRPSPEQSISPSVYYRFTLTAAPSSLPTGSLSFNNTNEDARYTLTGATGSGDMGSDELNMYCSRCTTSLVAEIAVPEPASMALFGAGLLGLAAVRRRRG